MDPRSSTKISVPFFYRIIMPRILFLAANPENADTLLAGDELRQIEAALKNTPFQVIAKPAARLNELPDLLRQYKPQIVHFSGRSAG